MTAAPDRGSTVFDATSMPQDRGGVSRYIAGVLQGLDQLGERVVVVVKAADVEWLRLSAPGHRYVTVPRLVALRPVRLLWEQLALPFLVLRLRGRILHSPHYTFPLVLARRAVVTLHDGTFFSDAAAHGALKRRFFPLWIGAARRFARATIAPSRATAREIERHRPGRRPVAVAHLGVDAAVFHPPGADDLSAFRSKHGLGAQEPWLAFLGTVEPRKRVGELLDAHARLRAADDVPVPSLLVAGGLGWDQDAAAALREAGDVPGAPVRYLGYLPLEELAAFLGGATVVVYPSTGEGFGLPVLEGMASGAPVLTTRRLALPEVGGDAVAYTEPTADEIVVSLESLLGDPDARARLAHAGRARSDAFTWRECARRHREVYGS